MGAVVAVVLLTPAIIAFSVDRFVQRKQVALLSSSAVPFAPKNNNALDYTMLVFCSFIAFLIICMIGMAQYASLITFWPYNLSFTLENFNFDLVEGGGWGSYFNSIKLSVYTALIGSIVIFFGAYLVEKGRGFQFGRNTFHAIAMVPLAVPGMALGLAYIFFFNNPNNPLNFVYGTMGILVISTITHFYTVSHLTATTALKQMDPEFESVSASLKTPFFRSFQKITLPICIPAILDISVYLFLNAMTTVSAVIFLYSANTRLASIAVLNMDDQGELAMAAAMAMMIAYTCGAVRLLYAIGSKSLIIRTQKWRDK
jgi:iron(III) transport system permease protein